MLQSTDPKQTPGPHKPAPPAWNGMEENGSRGHGDPILSKHLCNCGNEQPPFNRRKRWADPGSRMGGQQRLDRVGGQKEKGQRTGIKKEKHTGKYK